MRPRNDPATTAHAGCEIVQTADYHNLRHCTATRADGSPCRAWALWDHPGQVCATHGGRHHAGPRTPADRSRPRTKPPACNCPAYGWPHRPAGGLCRWPLPPVARSATRPGTHRSKWDRPRKGQQHRRPRPAGLAFQDITTNTEAPT